MYFKLDLMGFMFTSEFNFFYIVRYPEGILAETTIIVQQSPHMAGRQIKDHVVPPSPSVRMYTDGAPASCLSHLQ